MPTLTAAYPTCASVIPALNEESIGGLLYFFEIACGISGYILGVNPFNQPGVEAYKKNMFALLNKPGSKKSPKLSRQDFDKLRIES